MKKIVPTRNETRANGVDIVTSCFKIIATIKTTEKKSNKKLYFFCKGEIKLCATVKFNL